METSAKRKQGLSESIRGTLDSARKQLRLYVVVRTALMMICWLLILFWVGAMLDYLPVQVGSRETPQWLRVSLLVLMVVGCLYCLLVWMLPRFWVHLPNRSIALLIERHFPQLNNELVTAVELSETDIETSNAAAHQVMLDRVHESINQRVSVVRTSELFNWQPIWALGVASVLGIVVTGIAAVGFTDWMGFWCSRLFALSDAPWPRRAVLRTEGVQLQLPTFTGQLSAERITLPFQDGMVRVPVGASVVLQVGADTEAEAVPEVCTLYYQAADGMRGRANLRRIGAPQEGWQQFRLDGPPLDSLTNDLVVDVVGLDARLRDLKLQVVEPTVVSQMQLRCEYPEYLLDSLSSRAKVEILNYRSGMRIPEGTRVTLVGSASSPLSKLQYVVRGSEQDSNAAGLEGIRVREVTPNGKGFEIPLGKFYGNMMVEIRAIDEFGLSSDQVPRYIVNVQEDTVPEVDARLTGIGIAITPKAVLPVRGMVRDDHAIDRVWAEMIVDNAEAVQLKLPVARDGELDTQIDLVKLAEQGTLQLQPKQTLGLVVAARDFFDLSELEHVGRSQPQQLSVVTEDELLVILDRQELELRQRLELIIAELKDLRGALSDLSLSLREADSSESAQRFQSSPRAPSISKQWGGGPKREITSFVALQAGENQDRETEVDGLDEDNRSTIDEIEENEEAAEEAARRRRLAILRAQQSVLQGDKSQQELLGVADRVDSIRRQLVNNRIDSYDRQTRLQELVHDPLVQVLRTEYEQLQSRLAELQTATMSDAGGLEATRAIDSLDLVLVELDAIIANMLDIESFNEIVDLVRTLLDEQEAVLEETEKQQKSRILDLLR